MSGHGGVYDPVDDLTTDRSLPSDIGDEWALVQDETTNGFRRVVYRDGAGVGPRRVSIAEDRHGGFHADQVNADWPNHTNWLTDSAAKDEDRVRESVPFDEALEAAIEYMAGGKASETTKDKEDTNSNPIERLFGAGWRDWLQPSRPPYDPSLEEELDAAGIGVEDLGPDDGAGDLHIEPPESVAGWELVTDEGDFISWKGNGGSPPAGFVRDETTATVSAQSHGGRWKHRWSAKVRYEGPGRDGKEHDTTSTIAGYTLTLSSGDKGYAKNRARAIGAAVEWMKENPSQGMSDNDSESEEESSGSGQTIEFGRLDAANEWRDNHEEYLCPDDRRTTMTVMLRSDVPDEIVDDARTQALASREGERKTYGQAKLSDDEKRYLDRNYDTWEWQKYGFEAMAAKAALQAEGATDWLNYYEPGEGIDGSLANMDRGKEMEAVTGAPAAIEGRYIDSDPDISEQANMAARAIGESCTHARTWCEQGDDVACEYLVSDCGWTEADVAELAEQVEAFEIEMDDLLTDDGGRLEPGADLEAPAVPKTGEIPGFAKGTLKRAWTGYRVAVREAAKEQEAAERFEEHRAEAERYAQIVNEVRERFGQEPMSFDRLGELNEVSPVALPDAPTNEENTTGFRAAVAWSQRTVSGFLGDAPYDPVEELGRPAVADTEGSDLEKARALHATRSEEAQTMDESIQAREQVTDFEEWADAPNMMDFVGVDDLESVLGLTTPADLSDSMVVHRE